MFTEIGRLYNDTCSHTILDNMIVTAQQIISIDIIKLFVLVVIGAHLVEEMLKPKKKSLPGPTFTNRFWNRNLPLYLKYTKWAKQFGPIYKLPKGNYNQDIIVLSCPKLIREAFNKEEFTGRPHSEFMDILDGHGIVNSTGDLWKNQRKFLQLKLRYLGMKFGDFQTRTLECKIGHAIDTYMKALLQTNGKPTNISSFLSLAISNVICGLLMSEYYTLNNEKFERFMTLIDEGFKLFPKMNSSWEHYLPFKKQDKQDISKKLANNRNELDNHMQMIIDEHKTRFNENNICDLVDVYLLEIKQAKEEGRDKQLFEGKDHDRHMKQIMNDLFSAGVETVKTTLEWAVILMLHHPREAEKVREELDRVVGRSRPTLKDFDYLPVTKATIHEIMRFRTVVALGTTHATTRDVEFKGYTIRAGSEVIPLVHAVHMNPELWTDPEVFRPSRFLTADGNFVKSNAFIPFGIGKRMCLGETLAKMEIFLIFSAMMHTFELRLPAGASLPSLVGNEGVTITPDPFQVCCILRDISCNSIRKVGSY